MFWGFLVFFESAGGSLFINNCYYPRAVPRVYNGNSCVVYLLLPKVIKAIKGSENSELCLSLASLKKPRFSKFTNPFTLSL